MIVVDSSVWIGHFRNEETLAVRILRELEPDLIVVGDVVLLEVLRGISTEREASSLEQKFRAYGVVAMLNPDLAGVAARNYRELRRRGITIRTFADLVIASYCIAQGHHLLHQDRDFIPFERHLGLLTLT